MRTHIPNLELYRTLIQLARVSAKLGKNRIGYEILMRKREALVAEAGRRGLPVSKDQLDHLCSRMVH